MNIIDPRFEISNEGYSCNGAFTCSQCYGIFKKPPNREAIIEQYKTIKDEKIRPSELIKIQKKLNTYIDKNIEIKQPILYNLQAPATCKLLIHESTGIKPDGVEYNPILRIMTNNKNLLTWQWYVKCIGDTPESCTAKPQKITLLKPHKAIINESDTEWTYSNNKIRNIIGRSPSQLVIELLLKKTCDLFDTLYQPKPK